MDRKTAKYIINILRHGTIEWYMRNQVLNRDRKHVQIGHYKNGNPKYKYYYKCQGCGEYFEDQNYLEMDHIEEVGHIDISIPDLVDWTSVVKRIFSEYANLQGLCNPCHKKKTQGNASIRYERKRMRNQEDDFDFLTGDPDL